MTPGDWRRCYRKVRMVETHDYRKITASLSVARLLHLACSWQDWAATQPALLAQHPGANTTEMVVLLELLGHRWRPGLFADFGVKPPELTPAGRQVLPLLTSHLEDHMFHGVPAAEQIRRAEDWLTRRRSWLPYVNGTLIADLYDLLWVCLGCQSPLCGLYEPPNAAFLAELRSLAGWPPTVKPEKSVVQVTQPRRRLY